VALDVAVARAAVGQAALARDEEALRAIADSLPALAAYAYERHRARAFANAIRGAHDSAVAELCLGVAAWPPPASTFVADSAQLRLLGGDRVAQAPATLPGSRRGRSVERVSPRLILSGAAVAAAVAALVVLPARSFDEAGPEASGIVPPARPTLPRVVVVDPPSPSPSSEQGAEVSSPDVGVATLVRATPRAPVTSAVVLQPAAEPSLRPASATRPRPRPRAPAPPPREPTAPVPEPAPVPPSDPPAPAPAPVAVTAPVAAVAPAATSRSREPKGKATGRANAPGQAKKAAAAATSPVAPSDVPAAAPPSAVRAPEASPPPPHPGQGHGRDKEHERGP
jgi:hypothetical protein